MLPYCIAMKKEWKRQVEAQPPSDPPPGSAVNVSQEGERNASATGDNNLLITGDHAQVTINNSAQPSTAPLLSQKRIDELISVYSQRLEEKVSRVRIFGDADPHPLDQVFVELTINEEYERRPNQAEFLGLMDSELRRMRSVFGDADQSRDQDADDPTQRHLTKTKRTIKPDELLRRHTHAIVTGAPGCGKTTLLRYLAWQTLKQWRDTASGDGTGSVSDLSLGATNNSRLPVFLELKQITPEAFKQISKQARKESEDVLANLLFTQTIATTINPNKAERDALKEHFLALLREGRVAIFLDGLDEVGGRKFFGDLQTAVTDFLHSAYGNNTVIISTRPFALRQLGDAKAMEIQPLTPRQIEQFIECYYRDVPERQQFQRELQRRRELRELARVPALLGFILQLWRKRGSVTDDKLELYAQITQELAAQLDREKEGIAPEREWLVEDKDGSLKLDLLRQLAFHQLFKGLIHPPYEVGGTANDVDRLVFTSEQLRAEAAAFARTLKEREGTKINPRNLAEDVKATALLRQVGTDHYAFTHLTLQEYLAAIELKNRPDCEQIFCQAYFSSTLSKMEILPITLASVDKQDELFSALEQLPESLSLTNLRLRVRALGYGARGNSYRFTKFLNRLKEILVEPSQDEQSYRRALLKSLQSIPTQAQECLEMLVAPHLPNTSSFRKSYAAESLTILGSEKSFDALVKALDPNATGGRLVSRLISYGIDETLVHYVCRALVRINPEKAIPILSSIHTFYSHGEIDRLLKQIGTDDAFKGLLIRSTRSSHNEDARSARELLRQCENDSVIATLVNGLKHNRDYIRELSVQILGHIGSDEYVEQMSDLLQDPGIAVRWKTASALEEISSEKAVEPLIKSLQDSSSDVRWCSASALGAIGSEKAVEGLIMALNDRYLQVEESAATALGWIGSERAVEPLITLLTRPGSPEPRIAAAFALLRIKSKEAIAPLIQCLTDENSEIRAAAAFALGGIPSEVAEEALLRCLSDNSYKVVGNATYALSNFSSEKSIPYLLELLNGKIGHEVMESAVGALISNGRKEAIRPLLQLLSAGLLDTRYIRFKVDAGLIASALPDLLEDGNKYIRKKAMEIIGYYCNGRDVRDRLASLSEADSDEDVRLAARKSLQEFETKLKYFDLYVPSEINCALPRPSLTAQERIELESRIAAKYQEVLRGGDAGQKGKALEELLAAVFASIPGFTVSESNYHTATEEIDLVLRNTSADPFWRGLGSLVLVEAKHWQAQRVGKNEYVQFYRKLENRGGHCTLGFLICTERFAETFHQEQLRDSKFPLRVVPIDGEGLRQLVEAEDRSSVLRGFVEQAVLK